MLTMQSSVGIRSNYGINYRVTDRFIQVFIRSVGQGVVFKRRRITLLVGIFFGLYTMAQQGLRGAFVNGRYVPSPDEIAEGMRRWHVGADAASFWYAKVATEKWTSCGIEFAGKWNTQSGMQSGTYIVVSVGFSTQMSKLNSNPYLNRPVFVFTLRLELLAHRRLPASAADIQNSRN